jgi:hypothetical protein
VFQKVDAGSTILTWKGRTPEDDRHRDVAHDPDRAPPGTLLRITVGTFPLLSAEPAWRAPDASRYWTIFATKEGSSRRRDNTAIGREVGDRPRFSRL